MLSYGQFYLCVAIVLFGTAVLIHAINVIGDVLKERARIQQIKYKIDYAAKTGKLFEEENDESENDSQGC